jgi:Asp-tRNA(Asn)/Glu-tRNA(Gln) amidotransferase A subunit family amidase
MAAMVDSSTLTELSALELARRIREQVVSPIDVVEAHIARIEAVNPALNAVVTPTFDLARRAARAATDAIIRSDPLGPLHGVPFTVKDNLDLAGVRSTCGLIPRADHYPDRDTTLVARMRAAGAIPLGKTNVPGNCGDYETINLLFGQTNNPWDVTRSVGGSTGGEAAIIAAGGSPLGLGTDIAGSIRLPAHFTGIVGLRPTSPALPQDGIWPPIVGRLVNLNAVGPMARRVEDVALAFDIMRAMPGQPLDLGALQGERVAFWFDDGVTPSSNAVRAAVQAAVTALKRAGMLPFNGGPDARRFATIGWVKYLQNVERQAWAAGFGNGEVWSPLEEIGRALRGRPRIATGALVLWTAIHYARLVPRVNGADWRERLRRQVHTLIGSGGVAVCPVFPTTAPRHGWSKWQAILLNSYITWVNLAGLPGLTVPVGRAAKNGMPVGVQLVGAPGAEQTLLAAGLVIQQALMPVWSGPLPPPTRPRRRRV